jgi:hypothetical protein
VRTESTARIPPCPGAHKDLRAGDRPSKARCWCRCCSSGTGISGAALEGDCTDHVLISAVFVGAANTAAFLTPHDEISLSFSSGRRNNRGPLGTTFGGHLMSVLRVTSSNYRDRRSATAVSRHCRRLFAGLNGTTLWTSHAARLLLTAMFKVALLLALSQAPGEATCTEGAETTKVIEECVLVDAMSEMRSGSTHSRRYTEQVVRYAPIIAAQRVALRDNSQGHVLHNGLNAPLRC